MHRFSAGFLLGLLIFFAANLLAAHFMSDCGLSAVFGMDYCADDIVRAGWPLQFYEAGGIAFHTSFNIAALIADISFGLTLASIMGWWFVRRGQPDAQK